MPTIEKKVNVRKRHEKAIAEYQAWLKANPKASKKRRTEMFDLLIDSGLLDRMLDA